MSCQGLSYLSYQNHYGTSSTMYYTSPYHKDFDARMIRCKGPRISVSLTSVSCESFLCENRSSEQLSVSLCLTRTLSLSLSHTLSHALFRSHSHTHSLTHSLTLSVRPFKLWLPAKNGHGGRANVHLTCPNKLEWSVGEMLKRICLSAKTRQLIRVQLGLPSHMHPTIIIFY